MERTLSELLVQYRKEAGMTIQELADASGVGKGTINKIIAGTTENPTLDNIKALAKALGKTLADFDGSVVERPALQLTREAREVAEAYQGLDERGRGAIRAAIQYERHPATEPAKPKMPPKPKRQDGIAEIRVYDQVAAAGLGNYLDEPAAHTEEFPMEAVPERADFGVVISGDSMEPTIKNGATVFVQAIPTVEHGEIGIFVLNGKAYCKRLEIDRGRREVRLVSLNPAYEDIIIKPSDRLDTQGKVIGQYQR